MKDVFRAAGFPIVLTRPFDRRTPSHQCGTVRFGSDPANSALDLQCRAHDHPNLHVVDASFLPTSAAVNPSLTIAARRCGWPHRCGEPPPRRARARRSSRRDPAGRRGDGRRAGHRSRDCAGPRSRRFRPRAPLAENGGRGRRNRIEADVRAKGAAAHLLTFDLADVAATAQPPAPSSRASAGWTASSTMPASGRPPRRPAGSVAGEFRPRHGREPARTLFFTQACVREMVALSASAHPRAVVTITSVSAELASPERADYCISRPGFRWR